MNDYDACKALLKIMDTAYGAPVITSFPEDRKEVEAEQLNESFPMGVQVAPEETERVSYSKTKTQGDATVTVSADAKSMDELHDVLRLAGIDVENRAPEQPEPEQPEPEQPDDAECDSCAGEEPERDEYTTDKQKIIDVIKARLANKLS